MNTTQIITFLVVLPIFVWGVYWVVHDIIEWLTYIKWIRRNQ